MHLIDGNQRVAKVPMQLVELRISAPLTLVVKQLTPWQCFQQLLSPQEVAMVKV